MVHGDKVAGGGRTSRALEYFLNNMAGYGGIDVEIIHDCVF